MSSGKVTTRRGLVPRHRTSGTARSAKRTSRRPPAARSAPNSGARTALQKHVDFFDTNHDGRITLSDTYGGLRRLGLGAARSAVFGSVINAVLGTTTSGAPGLTVDATHIHTGKHQSDTGVYDARGRFVQRSFDQLFARYDDDGDGALDGKELARLFAGNRTDFFGNLGSAAEFKLLLHLAGEFQHGRKVLTRARLQRFYNGSLFYQLADEVAARRATAGTSLAEVVGNSLRELY